MSRISINPALIYSPDALKVKGLNSKSDTLVTEKKADEAEKVKVQKPNEKIEISQEAKDLKEKLENIEKAHKIHAKKFGNVEKPGIYFVSGFDWFGAGSIKGNYDGINDMAEAIEGAKHFAWDEKEELIEDILKRKPDQPIVLVGHSFGGDTVVEVANELNNIDKGFRKINLMITLDSVGANNDTIPQNVAHNLNFVADGPFDFLNDGANMASNYTKTKVENFARREAHSELDDSIDIQVQIMDEIDKALLA